MATDEGAVLIDGAGHYQKLRLRMPGISVRYRDADEFAISNDGWFVAFKVEARDRKDKAPDANDPYAKFGKLYDELIYEHTRGSKPITIAKSAIHFYGNGQPYGKFVSLPAWSPDSKRIAYAYQKRGRGFLPSAGIVIADISKQGGVVSTGTVEIPPVHQPDDASVDELRWSPDGTKLGLIVFEYWYENSDQYSRYTLYTVNANGRGLRAVRFSNKNINVSAFAWSPSGEQFALRSDYQAKKLCNFNLMFYFDTGNQPCRVSENLFTSNVDGSGLKRMSKEPDFRHGQLFWIQ
ncbi:MAG: eIF2A-related protein [Acidiferrobacteraceae bacterium]